MDIELLIDDGRKLKFALKKSGVGFYQVQGICKKIMEKVKFDKYNEAKGIILEAYITAEIPVPQEIMNIEDDRIYAFIGGLVPGKKEFE